MKHTRIAEKGFSLVDILSVMAVAAVVTTIALPSLRGFAANYRLAAAADELAAELNAARVMAVSRSTTYQVTFNQNENAYRIVDLADPANPTRVQRSLASGVQLKRTPVNPITFSSRGAARGGAVVLSSTTGRVIVVAVQASGRTLVNEMSNDSLP